MIYKIANYTGKTYEKIEENLNKLAKEGWRVASSAVAFPTVIIILQKEH